MLRVNILLTLAVITRTVIRQLLGERLGGPAQAFIGHGRVLASAAKPPSRH